MCSIFDDDLVVYEGHPEIPAVSHNSESFRVQPLTPANAGPGGAGKFVVTVWLFLSTMRHIF